jgi:F0F1-type ATP synthase membrane subunit b/b'
MLFRWINSLIILGGIGWGFMKLKGAFRERAVAISTAINQAAIAKKESERRMQDVERKFARLDEEIAGFREAAKRDAALEAEKIRKQAAEEVEKVERAALAEIAASERVARTELRAKAARLAVERAEALIRKQMTADAQSKLLNGFVAELARSVN